VHPQQRVRLRETLASADAAEAATLRKMAQAPSAFWVDSRAKIHGGNIDTVEGILRNASTTRQLCVFMLYNLPNRDCNAKASGGELCCERSASGVCDDEQGAGRSCESGLAEYKNEYISPLATLFGRFHLRVPIVLYAAHS
jgi:cellulase/cellobiase CelA1